MSGYKLPCGCVVERNSERIITMCQCCEAEFNERHERAVEDRKRFAAPAIASPDRVLAPGGLPISEFQSNIRTAVHPGSVPEDVQ